MLQKIFKPLILALAVVAFSSCEPCVDGVGKLTTEVREIDDFSKLDINVPADVFLIKGSIPEITIKSHENIISRIKTNVRGKTLKLDSRGCIGELKRLRIDIVVNDLSDISINGSGSLKTTSQLSVEKLRIKVNGSGDIGMDILANTIEAKINGSGDIILNGTTKVLKVNINGSGDFKGLGMQSYNSAVEINGSGDVKLNVKNNLFVEIKGSGSVSYEGSPNIKTNIIGSGQVKKRND